MTKLKLATNWLEFGTFNTSYTPSTSSEKNLTISSIQESNEDFKKEDKKDDKNSDSDQDDEFLNKSNKKIIRDLFHDKILDHCSNLQFNKDGLSFTF